MDESCTFCLLVYLLLYLEKVNRKGFCYYGFFQSSYINTVAFSYENDGGTVYHPVQGDVTIQMKAFEQYFF